MAYRYGLRSRPLSIGAVPRGFISGSLQQNEHMRYGTVDYPEPLSQEDIERYELVDMVEWEQRKAESEESERALAYVALGLLILRWPIPTILSHIVETCGVPLADARKAVRRAKETEDAKV